MNKAPPNSENRQGAGLLLEQGRLLELMWSSDKSAEIMINSADIIMTAP